MFKIEKEGDVTYHSLDNGIVVVTSPKACRFLGEVGGKIKKGRPFLEIEGVEYYYKGDVLLVEVEKTREYIGIIKGI